MHGRCYLELARKVGDITEAEGLFAQAIKHHQEQLKLAKQLTDEQTSIQEQIYAQSWLGGCYLEQAIKDNSQTETLIKDAKGYFLGSLELLPQLDDEKKNIKLRKEFATI